MQPNECKYCGCGDVLTSSEAFVHFGCGSGYWPGADQWTYANKCVGKCAARVAELEERVQRAVAVLEGARRICVGLCDEDGEDVESEHDGVIYVESTEVDRAAAILRGNSPESPDSSPVTADQLATADYFEAVRQRVPWMVSVEHIEGLVEGYRRCGVMVWQTAEEIRKVHGGEYGQAD